MAETVRETIKNIIRNHLKKKKGKVFGQCLTAVGWVGGTLPELYEKDGMIELSMADVAGGGIVICTALIPGKKAPVIIRGDMIKVMQKGSIIYDLAASQGGNTEFTKPDETIDINGVKILGDRNLLNKLAISASNLYSKNLLNFVTNLYDKKNDKVIINLEDEIINKTLVK